MLFRYFKSFIVATLVILGLLSCRTNEKQELLIALNNSIVQSNNIIDVQILDILHSIEEKLNDPITTEKARIWYPKAAQIQSLSTEMITNLENQKNSKIDIDSLIKQVKDFPTSILRIDPKINEAFKDSFDKLFVKSSTLKSALSNDDSISVIALINGIENSIRIAESKALAFCNEQNSLLYFEYPTTSAIISQNSSYIQKGENIEIIAGIGAFSTRNNPIVKINHKQVPLSENGVAIYKFKSSQKAGRYNVPVDIEYVDQDGKKIKLNRTITYTVSE